MMHGMHGGGEMPKAKMPMHDEMVGKKKKKAKKGGKLQSALEEVYGNPYKITKNNTVIKTSTGEVKGHHASRAKALAQFRLLEGIAHGWKPTRNK